VEGFFLTKPIIRDRIKGLETEKGVLKHYYIIIVIIVKEAKSANYVIIIGSIVLLVMHLI
jgi:hypothetical protein